MMHVNLRRCAIHLHFSPFEKVIGYIQIKLISSFFTIENRTKREKNLDLRLKYLI
jgi:hypothetical protein